MNDIYMAGPWITDHEVAIVTDAMKNGWYGKKTYYYCEEFEKIFAEWHDRKYALMTPNCTSAIHLILLGLGIGPGDEVIVPECTWIATAAPIQYVGATSVFVDIDPLSWCIDPDSLLQVLTARTKAVIAVDLFGNMPQMEKIMAICAKYKVHFIEDAAEALGSTYHGVRAGKFGVASVFSFHRTKTLTTGEGGMLLTDDDDIFQRCKFLRDHGRNSEKAYWVDEVAVKYMPFNLQAALGYAQFLRIDELVGKKHWILEKYKYYLKEVQGLSFNYEPEGVFNGAWCTAVVWDASYGKNKAQVMAGIEAKGLPARPFFYPLSMLPAYSHQGKAGEYREKNYNAYDISDRGINMPSAFNITEEQIKQYCNAFVEALKS